MQNAPLPVFQIVHPPLGELTMVKPMTTEKNRIELHSIKKLFAK